MGLSSGARLEDALNTRIMHRRWKRGWRPAVVAFTGYGSKDFVRVLARVLMQDPEADYSDPNGGGALAEAQRGWRLFLSTHVTGLPVTITAGRAIIHTRTDRAGYIDVIIRKHGLRPGWQEVTIDPVAAEPVKARVLIVSPDARVGLISDIDDTVMVTYLPRALIAAWNTFVRHTTTRKPVPGMSELYATLRERHPEIPVFYLSTGAWNVVPTLTTFLRTHGYPEGPMLMTDWGPTNTGWFRSGQEHKRTALRRLAIEFPKIKWLLVGDDGQHDPAIYREMAREHPEHVRAILIRQLNPVEQILAHGTTTELPHPDDPAPDDLDRPVPFLVGSDGYELAGKLPPLAPQPPTRG